MRMNLKGKGFSDLNKLKTVCNITDCSVILKKKFKKFLRGPLDFPSLRMSPPSMNPLLMKTRLLRYNFHWSFERTGLKGCLP